MHDSDNVTRGATQTVRRAIIPCGGKGTRMLAVTGGKAKELLPVRGEPVLAHVLRECAQSGIDDVLVVISPDKDDVAAQSRRLAGTHGLPARINITVQPEPRGLADAIRQGYDFANGEPVAVALPDNLFVNGPSPALEQVIETHRRVQISVVGLTEITVVDAARRGPTPVYAGERRGNDFLVTQIPSKGARGTTFNLGEAGSAVTGVGRYVFTSEVFATIHAVEGRLTAGAELDDIPVMQDLLTRGLLTGRILQGTFLDVGLPQGYQEAVTRLGV